LAAYYVAKEGILNALKHAGASSIEVRIRMTDEAASVEVADDGEGFFPSEVDESSHFGIGLIRERIQRLGGRFAIQSKRGVGTRVLASLPIIAARGQEDSSRSELQRENPGRG
jgi:signal transduction histidine kinase